MTAGLAVPPALGFAALMAAAMALYPGGTWDEPALSGHRFWANYFCDLMRPTALNGAPNPLGAQLSELGLLSLAVALLPFFLAVPCLFPERRRLALFVRLCGVTASLGGVGVVFVPSHRFGALAHGIVLLLAAVPGIAAAVASVVGLWTARRRAPVVTALSVATLLLAVVTAAVFARQLHLGVESTPPLAPLQKLLALAALTWICATGVRVAAGRAVGQQDDAAAQLGRQVDRT